MDYLRSSYQVDAVFRAGDVSHPILWRKADPGAIVFPGFHVYGSANWDERECKAGDLGEQPGARPWSNSKPAGRVPGDLAGCGFRRWFQSGLSAGESGNVTYPDCYPSCCTPSSPSYWGGSPVPDRIIVTPHSSFVPLCNLGGYIRVMFRLRNHGMWLFEAQQPDPCYPWLEYFLQRTGPLDTDWQFDCRVANPLGNLYQNLGTLTAFSKSPFSMTWTFFPFVGPWWTAPVTMILTSF